MLRERVVLKEGSDVEIIVVMLSKVGWSDKSGGVDRRGVVLRV